MALHPRAPRLADGSTDLAQIAKTYVPLAPPDNGEPLSKLRRRCQALYEKQGRRYPPDATRDECLRTLEFERQYQASFRTKGKRLQRGATFAECLVTLAGRLGVYTRDCDPKTQPGPGIDLLFGPWGQLWESVGEKLILAQPEFWTLLGATGPGRPAGAGNKQIKMAVTKEAERQRRRRQKSARNGRVRLSRYRDG
jgi:hypothetical protein